jgi:hypothetical protein
MLPLLACAAVLGCHDLLSSDGPAKLSAPQAAAGHTVGVLDCTADVRLGTITCSPPHAAAGDHGARPALLGQGQMKMASTNVAFDGTTRIFRADVTTQNLLAEAIGTPDGTTASGVKVFFSSGPTPTAFASGDTGTVRVENPDGYGNFTAAHQPYFLYSQILAPNQVSAARQWRWFLGPSVNSFSFQVKVFAATPGETTIPATIPENWGQPARYFRPEWRINCRNIGLPACVYDVVDIAFQPWASQEDREAAVDVIGGTLESGSRMTGFYYVRIPSDTTLAPVARAIETLKTLPQVRWAFAHDMTPLSLNYLRPNDGSNWSTADWETKDSLAAGRNWSFEAISAPLAWGCRTGDATVPVAVVDYDFEAVPDLAQTYELGRSFGIGRFTVASDSVDHGTEIAAIIGAHGNDSTGMVGMMWRSSLRVYDIAADTAPGVAFRDAQHQVVLDADTTLARIRIAATDGAEVINVSLGNDWNGIAIQNGWIAPGGRYDPGSETNPARRASNLSRVQRQYATFRATLDTLATQGFHPLLVIAAGNNAVDAYWNGFTITADSVQNVIVVGAVRNAGNGRLAAMNVTISNQSFGSNYGPLVKVVAPGQEVWTWSPHGAVAVDGTSFAAPFVAGAAGLLIAFDPSLARQPNIVRQILTDGARRGRRKVQLAGGDSASVLNIYESLKLAAQRPGAPLCGSRVWQANGHIYAQRDTTPGAPGEALFASSGRVTDLQVRHGGRRVEFNDRDGGGHRLFEWQAPGTWAEVPDTAARYDSIFLTTAPSYHSYYGESHDGDSVAYVRTVGSSYEVHLQHIDTVTYHVLSDQVIAQIPTGASGDMTQHVCTYRTGAGCYDSVAVGTARSAATSQPAFSPRGDSLLLAVYWTTTTVSVGSPYTCPNWWAYPDPAPECSDVNTSWASTGGSLYAIPLKGGGAPQVVATTAGGFREVAIADGSGEFTAQVITSSGSGTTSYTGAHRTDFGYSGSSSETCRTEFRSLKRPATVAAFFNECSPAAATFSPNRRPRPAHGAAAGSQVGLFPTNGATPRIFATRSGLLAPLLSASGP